ncbi:hypothetical protein AOLI_G00213710 [Acnodon oligacanthus]
MASTAQLTFVLFSLVSFTGSSDVFGLLGNSVEAPVLASASRQLSNNTCNITLTCRGHGLSLNSSCYNETCEEMEMTSPTSITLSLSVNGSSIICNNSNPVSWKEAVLEMEELKQLCADNGEFNKKEDEQPLQLLLLAVVVIGVIILLVTFISFYLCWRKSTGPTHCENTVYAEVKRNGAATSITLETYSTVYSVPQKKPLPASIGQFSQTTTVFEKQVTMASMYKKWAISAEPCISSIYESVPDQTQPMKSGTIYSTTSNLSKAYYTDLATIHNEQEHQNISDLLGSVEHAWIGLFFDNWKWSDRRSTSFRYWKAGQPWSPTGNSSCVAVVTSWKGQWDDTLCDAKLPFMCYKALRQRIVKLTITSNGKKDLNDPAMKTAILSQIEKKLRTQGTGNDASVSWREKNGKVLHLCKKRMMENDKCG